MSLNGKRDAVTDWAAIVLSTLVALSLWVLFIYEYAFIGEFGEVNHWLMLTAGVFSVLAALTLFGHQKVAQALELARDS